ncbi:MAG: hypothetical protein CMD33_08280 [Flavobacteriales bacterium]|nr:hypothetical protein [Flavobacteriales bacterium]
MDQLFGTKQSNAVEPTTFSNPKRISTISSLHQPQVNPLLKPQVSHGRAPFKSQKRQLLAIIKKHFSCRGEA